MYLTTFSNVFVFVGLFGSERNQSVNSFIQNAFYTATTYVPFMQINP